MALFAAATVALFFVSALASHHDLLDRAKPALRATTVLILTLPVPAGLLVLLPGLLLSSLSVYRLTSFSTA
jgi:hypothetical protein